MPRRAVVIPFLTGSIIALLGGSAVAADLPVKAPRIVCPICDWNGLYVGVNAGGSIGSGGTYNSIALNPPGGTAGVINPLSTLAVTNSPAGALAGAQIGFNKQIGRFVWGIEADADWTGQRDTLQAQSFLASSVVVAHSEMLYGEEQKLKWLSTVRGRLGLTHDYSLWYVTGGAAFGGFESNRNFVVNPVGSGVGAGTFVTAPGAASNSTNRAGWTVGGGVETSLAALGGSNRWSAKFEYLFVDLGTVSNAFSVPVAATPAAAYTYASSTHILDHIVRVGLNYRVGGPDQPSAGVVPGPCPTCDWRGFYAGLNAGGSIGRDGTNDSIPLVPPGGNANLDTAASSMSVTNSPSGALGGGQAGFNWQAGNWVFGAEGDVDWTGQRNRVDRTNWLASTIVVAPTVMSYSDQQSLEWLATARARVGWSQGCFLWYATGGAAFGQIDSTYNFQAVGGPGVFGTAPASAGFRQDKTGWTLGGGVETALPWMDKASRWSAKLEYLYVDLGNVNNAFTVPVTGGTAVFAYSSATHFQDHIVRAGINYRFGG